MDIHKIVDVFNKLLEIAKYSRMVPFEEIERNEYNLNIPRYIDSQQAEDVQDIDGHLRGGIPTADVDALQRYWDVCPQLRRALFKNTRPGYLNLTVDKQAIKSAIYEHSEFVAFIAATVAHDPQAGVAIHRTVFDQMVKEFRERGNSGFHTVAAFPLRQHVRHEPLHLSSGDRSHVTVLEARFKVDAKSRTKRPLRLLVQEREVP
jgi:N-6 DNA Methylase